MKLIVVDDHPLVWKGLEMVIREEKDIEIVGFALDGKQALELVEKRKPDVVLVDLRLPEENGLDIIKKARKINSHCKYVILTTYVSQEDINRAIIDDVDGYILKEAYPEELIAAIRVVAKGRKFYDSKVIMSTVEKSIDVQQDNINNLTGRELEVLEALSRGLSNKAIAQELVISENTVKKHVRRVLDKLNFKDRTQAALYAVSRGFGGDREN